MCIKAHVWAFHQTSQLPPNLKDNFLCEKLNAMCNVVYSHLPSGTMIESTVMALFDWVKNFITAGSRQKTIEISGEVMRFSMHWDT